MEKNWGDTPSATLIRKTVSKNLQCMKILNVSQFFNYTVIYFNCKERCFLIEKACSSRLS